MKRQAAYHGEIGANGKAYQKGQFIAEQEDYTMRASKRKKGSGKQEIEPYKWEVPADPEMKSIFAYVGGVYACLRTGEISYNVIEYYNEDPKKIESLVARYQAGERWFYPNQEIYI